MALNHLGEKEYRTYGAWRRAVLAINPQATFDGNKDICCAIGVGEWNGETGSIYSLANRRRFAEACK